MMIEVKVKLRTKKAEVVEVGEGVFEVSVIALPDKGKANQAVIKALAEHFGVASSLIEIIRGHTSRKKIVSVPD